MADTMTRAPTAGRVSGGGGGGGGGGPGGPSDVDREYEQAAFLEKVKSVEGMESQVDELQALVKKSKEEQAMISSKIMMLKGGTTGMAAPALRSSFTEPGGGGSEVMYLREQLAYLDSMLVEKDAELERLRSIASMFMASKAEVKMGGVWRERCEEAKLKLQNMAAGTQFLQKTHSEKASELSKLTMYVKVLEASQMSNDSHCDRLLEEKESKHAAAAKSLEVEQTALQSYVRVLEEGFLRCVGRVTQSMASGVTTVSIDNSKPLPLFVALRINSTGQNVLEVFQEPDSNTELHSIILDSSHDGVNVVEDKEGMILHLTGNIEPGRKQLGQKMRKARDLVPMSCKLCCINMEEFLKWSTAVRLMAELMGMNVSERRASTPFEGR